jgi:hypothetical protein
LNIPASPIFSIKRCCPLSPSDFVSGLADFLMAETREDSVVEFNGPGAPFPRKTSWVPPFPAGAVNQPLLASKKDELEPDRVPRDAYSLSFSCLAMLKSSDCRMASDLERELPPVCGLISMV